MTHSWFTVYPPGFSPYQRVAAVSMDALGAPLAKAVESEDRARSQLGAAAAAAAGERWDEAGGDRAVETPTLPTQRRRIEVFGRILGLTHDRCEQHAEMIAAELGVAMTVYRSARVAFARPLRRMQEMGQAILDVVRDAGWDERLWLHLVAAIHLSKAWGPVGVSDQETGRTCSPLGEVIRARRELIAGMQSSVLRSVTEAAESDAVARSP